MDRRPNHARDWFGLGWTLAWWLAIGAALAPGPARANEPPGSGTPDGVVTNLTQVRDWMGSPIQTNLPVALTGVVAGVFPDLSLVVVHDETGNAGIRLDLRRFPWLKPQQRVRIEGRACIGSGQASLLPELVVDNDGLHAPTEVIGQMDLAPGRHPFELDFFQLGDGFDLKLEYDGPGITRRPLPAAALTHVVNPLETAPLYAPGMGGVEYDYYEGAWNGMPDFNEVTPVRSGFLNDIETSPRRQDTNFAFRYQGDLQIEQPGKYHFYLTSDDGSRLFVQAVPTVVRLLGLATAAPPATTNLLQIGMILPEEKNYSWGAVEGTVDFAGRNGKHWRVEITSEGSRLELLVDPAARLPAGLAVGSRIRAMGFCQGAFEKPGQMIAATLLVPGTNFISLLDTSSRKEFEANGTAALPVLTTAEEIRHLAPKEAARGYPVRLLGVITVRRIIPEGILQDLTSAVYVFFDPAQSSRLRDGDYVELAGVTAPGGFANVVMMRSANVLGTGTYPEPLHPDYAQLIGGSMDCQWVELEGLVSRILDERHFQLIVKGGLITAEIQANSDQTLLAGLSNAFVRVRGAVIPGRNEAGEATREVYFWIPSPGSITVDKLPPADPFQAPLKQVSELSLFDPNPNYHQFIRLRGQILLKSDSNLYFADDTGSLRIEPKTAPRLEAGDLVEAVGLPDVLKSPPVLIEATVRKTGQAGLPPPPLVNLDQVSQSEYSGRRVRVEGQLIYARVGYRQGVLVIQSGLKTIQAVGPIKTPTATLPPLGSRASVCGVVSATGNAGEPELMLNSLADVTCLQLPPFWTRQRVLLLVVILTGTLLLAALWILFLRRTVAKRSRALRVEMTERQNAEDKVRAVETLNALEAQRNRIARNIHDDLGARVTKLSRLVGQIAVSGTDAQSRLDEIAATSRQMVETLDETVWTVNAVNDSLPKLANYIAHFAEDLFRQTPVQCELDIPLNLPEWKVAAEFRFNLLMVVKEALNNALKHAEARAVLLKMVLLPGQLQLVIRDDGKGFDPAIVLRRNGLANLQTRVSSLGGQITFNSAPGTGTEILVTVPLLDPVAPFTPSSRAT